LRCCNYVFPVIVIGKNFEEILFQSFQYCIKVIYPAKVSLFIQITNKTHTQMKNYSIKLLSTSLLMPTKTVSLP
jgi:hypothetical protein